jgi:hypothetical protein
MGMFDYYVPAGDHHCPVCDRPLREWQGKDGPNFLFVFAEGNRYPIDQRVDEEIKTPRDEMEANLLPRRFVIYSHDCPDHRPIDADCRTVDDVWGETLVRAFSRLSPGSSRRR